ncbi:hypothetical protein H257_01943 [Aphanomyces astaci]|uniref:Uncharacterized protein n=1 Tax=Aphanomyces astaci TaxID=112090 RepID=W4H4T1_APHAT|nr:hypothetical protein H257_01943 [Aphanomyces astaci]ETV86912.1 hypothetical protein H257_01943 [Aphanomyces astaci]|eukprot:XP_009823711.1 hypothetical protein H257_01943 [Aphanomyces astaci]
MHERTPTEQQEHDARRVVATAARWINWMLHVPAVRKHSGTLAATLHPIGWSQAPSNAKTQRSGGGPMRPDTGRVDHTMPWCTSTNVNLHKVIDPSLVARRTDDPCSLGNST